MFNSFSTPKDKTWLFDLIRSALREELSRADDQTRAEWLTTERAAALLQICPTSLEKARSTGRGQLASIPYHKIGRSVRYCRIDIDAALARLRMPGRAFKD